MVSLQGIGAKNYPYFPIFVPLSLLTAVALQYLIADTKLSKKRVSAIVGLVFLAWFGLSVYRSREKLALVIKWPESQLVAEIKRHIKHERDLFTLKFQPYIYLETGTSPPISRSSYISWQWDFYGTKPELHRELWRELEIEAPTVVTRPVEIPVPDSAVIFMSKYRELGLYPKVYEYGGDTVLYVQKGDNLSKRLGESL